uniref:Uncharacterized protein n=1 Tax=Anguilla anguilla TaxID=7936 RepID=A0A0E9UFZ1_ANGAN
MIGQYYPLEVCDYSVTSINEKALIDYI